MLGGSCAWVAGKLGQGRPDDPFPGLCRSSSGFGIQMPVHIRGHADAAMPKLPGDHQEGHASLDRQAGVGVAEAMDSESPARGSVCVVCVCPTNGSAPMAQCGAWQMMNGVCMQPQILEKTCRLVIVSSSASEMPPGSRIRPLAPTSPLGPASPLPLRPPALSSKLGRARIATRPHSPWPP